LPFTRRNHCLISYCLSLFLKNSVKAAPQSFSRTPRSLYPMIQFFAVRDIKYRPARSRLRVLAP